MTLRPTRACAQSVLGVLRWVQSSGINRRAVGPPRWGPSAPSGKPLVFVLSGGERHESLYLSSLLAAGAVRRVGRGRPRVRPDRIVGDKGYSYPTVRRLLARRGIEAVVPYRRDQRPGDRRHCPFDRAAYRERNRIERLINRLKQWRRVATRYDKRPAHYAAMLTLAAALLWV